MLAEGPVGKPSVVVGRGVLRIDLDAQRFQETSFGRIPHGTHLPQNPGNVRKFLFFADGQRQSCSHPLVSLRAHSAMSEQYRSEHTVLYIFEAGGKRASKLGEERRDLAPTPSG